MSFRKRYQYMSASLMHLCGIWRTMVYIHVANHEELKLVSLLLSANF